MGVDNSGDVRLWGRSSPLSKGDCGVADVVSYKSNAVKGKCFIKFVNFIADANGTPVLLLSASGARGPSYVGIFKVDGTKEREVLVNKAEPMKSVAIDVFG